MSQDPNNPNRLDPNLQDGGTYNISTNVSGTFFGGLYGTYNFSSGTTFTTSLVAIAINVNSGSGNTSIINLDSVVTGRVSISGVTEFNFSDLASINTSSTAITLSNATGVMLDANIDGAITARSVLNSSGNATVNVSDSAVFTGTSTAQTALSIGASSTLNFNGEISAFSTGVETGANSAINISDAAIIDVTSGQWIVAGDDTDLTISSGATLTYASALGGGVSIGDNSTVDLQVDLISGGTALSIGLNTGFVLNANLTLQSVERDGLNAQGNNIIIINGTVIGDDEGLDLNGTNTTLLVASGATISATGPLGDAIVGGTGHVYDIFGTVLAGDDGIIIGSQATLNIAGDVSVGGTAIAVGGGTSVDISSTLIFADERILTASTDLILTVGAGVELRAMTSTAISAGVNANITLAAGSELNSLDGLGISVSDNANVTLNGNITSERSALNIGDNGIVNIGQDAVITVTDGDVISADDGLTINVAGTVTALEDTFGAIRGDANNTINLLQSGIINSESTSSSGFGRGDGIYVFDENNVINVHGTINASDNGISMNNGGGNTITIFDTGVINARTAIQTSNDSSAPLANSVLVEGTLNVSDTGVEMFGIGDSTIVTGSIVGVGSSATGVRGFGEENTINVSGDISNVETGIASSNNSDVTLSGEITATSFGISAGGLGSQVTVTSEAVINVQQPVGEIASAIGIFFVNTDGILDFQGTINAQNNGIVASGTSAVLNVSGTINAFGGLVFNGFTIPPTAVQINQAINTGPTTLNLTGVINTDGTGVFVNGAANVTINGTINAVTAIQAGGGGQVYTFGSNANITGDLIFGEDDDNIDLSLATIADNTLIFLGSGDDVFVGSGADETIDTGFGTSDIDGGDGTDNAIIFGNITEYNISVSGDDVITIASLDSAFFDGVHTFENVEFFTFNDGTVSADELLNGGATIEGTAGDDVLDGTLFFDFIFGFDGNDTINGLDGDDVIEGGNGDDILNGGDGDDDIDGGDGDDILNGGDGNDFLFGGLGADTINGNAGDDVLAGQGGDDTLNGGTGNDLAGFFGFIEDFTFDVNAGVYTITDTTGAEGVDTITEVETFAFFDAEVSAQAIDNQQIGTSASETLIGTSNDDLIFGLAGNDIINSGLGADVIVAGAGNDSVNASNGDDFIIGGDGDDIIIGGLGADDIDGGNGTDQARYANSNEGVFVDLELGFSFGGHADGDRFFSIEDVFGSAHDDTLIGNAGDNALTGLDGDDTLNGGLGDDTLNGGLGNDFLNGGDGIDQVSYVDSDAAVTINFTTGETTGGHAEGDTLVEIENVFGSDFADTLTGDAGNNVLTGFFGNDIIAAAGGDDILNGGAGNDNLRGEVGNDTLNGGDDNDIIDGGNGEDIIDGGAGADTIRGGGDNDTIEGGLGNDSISAGIGDDTVHGGGNNDTILGQGGDDIIFGDGGTDTLRGGSGNDTLHGGDARDILFGQGNNDILYGEGGNDTLSGAGGLDQLFGGDGNDNLNGGIGADRLDGGTGNDILNGGGVGGADGARDSFVFAVGYEQDRINSFDQASNDRIELDDALWAAAGTLTAQEVVDMFGSLNGSGSILTLNFGNGDILEVQNAAGIDIDTFGADILVI